MRPLLAGVGNIFVRRSSYYGTRLRTWVLVTLWTAAIAAVIVGGVYGIVKAVRSAGAASCRTFARQSGYTTKYRLMHFLDGGNCLVQTPSGKWMTQNRVLVTLRR